ncbi:MAG: hypothetical protein KIT14_18740 [bacterium]|nr:hypothetical protein [bacterium]
MPVRLALLALALVWAPPVHALTVLNTGKVATFKNGKGMIRVGKDRGLAAPTSPLCPETSRLSLSSYPQATKLVKVHLDVALACEGWRTAAGGFVWEDPSGNGAIRKVVYAPKKLLVKFSGVAFDAPAGPVGYVHTWLTIGDTRLHTRFHNFRRNDATALLTRQPSKAAADGEAAFWDVLHQNVTGAAKAAREAEALALLAKAAKRDKRDGRSRFLLAMMRLYRFGQAVDGYHDATPEATADLAAAADAFGAAVPMLWNPATNAGDSRVPGFAAATTFGLGFVTGDPALQAQGLAELEYAVAINEIFNFFDYIPVAQAVPASDPMFADILARMDAYLANPANATCIATQPEICGDAGLAPHNAAGALILFGDIYAKGGEVAQATQWYGLAAALAARNPAPYRFQSALDRRLADPAGRAALYQDADPANDPPIIGARAEACANCHAK